MEIIIVGFLERSSENSPDYEDVAKTVLDKLRLMEFHHYIHVQGSNTIDIHIDNMIELPAAINRVKELSGLLKSYYVHYDHLDEVSKALANHDYFKAFSLCTSLYESFAKGILKRYVEFKGLSLNSKRLDRLQLESLILMLYTNGLILEGTFSDMVSVTAVRNDQIHRYLDKFLSEEALKDIDDNVPMVMRSLGELKRIHEGFSKSKA